VSVIVSFSKCERPSCEDRNQCIRQRMHVDCSYVNDLKELKNACKEYNKSKGLNDIRLESISRPEISDDGLILFLGGDDCISGWVVCGGPLTQAMRENIPIAIEELNSILDGGKSLEVPRIGIGDLMLHGQDTSLNT
jgi:hypothetical protein